MIGRPCEKGTAMSHSSRPIHGAPLYRFACVESSVGRILIAMTDRGVVDIIRGDSRAELLRAALTRHPGADFVPDSGEHAHWVAAILKRIERPDLECCVPFDIGPHRRCRAAS